MRSEQGQGCVTVRLRTGSALSLEDKKRCRVVSDERCVMCDSRVGKDVAHFLEGCGKLVWLDKFWRVD